MKAEGVVTVEELREAVVHLATTQEDAQDERSVRAFVVLMSHAKRAVDVDDAQKECGQRGHRQRPTYSSGVTAQSMDPVTLQSTRCESCGGCSYCDSLEVFKR